MFLGIAIPIIIATAYSAGSTIYLNLASHTKGPVHWHADYEVWNCGENLDLLDPTGMANRIGTPTLHEHNDNRIHLEGVPVVLSTASIGSFFSTVGGHIAKDRFSYETNNGLISVKDGDLCNGQPGKVQVFLLKVDDMGKTDNWVYSQTKLEDPARHVISPSAYVPPGDCFIVEFGPEKESTDKICETYEIAMRKGELRGS